MNGHNVEKQSNTAALVTGIMSIVFGSTTFFVQIFAGLCCGWIGWGFGVIAIVLGIVSIVIGVNRVEKLLGGIGIGLSIIGVIIQLLFVFVWTAGNAAGGGMNN
ncbi:MAG: hypothetical protein ABRQ37_28815 [Candidatus Eremiobacterota bacterium]